MKIYTSYSKYLKIKFIRKDGPGVSSSYRGFVAGYVMFSKYFMGYGDIIFNFTFVI